MQKNEKKPFLSHHTTPTKKSQLFSAFF